MFFFFLGVKLKSGRETHFWHFLQFFSREKIGFHAHFFPLFCDFSRLLFFSRPLLRFFFSRVKNMVSRPKIQEFSQVFLLLTGKIFDFFHAHFFSFHGRNFRKFPRAKINFHGYFLGLFQFFSRALFSFTPKIPKFFTGDFFISRKKKKTVTFVSIRSSFSFFRLNVNQYTALRYHGLIS